jgi:hypothetical protein
MGGKPPMHDALDLAQSAMERRIIVDIPAESGLPSRHRP